MHPKSRKRFLAPMPFHKNLISRRQGTDRRYLHFDGITGNLRDISRPPSRAPKESTEERRVWSNYEIVNYIRFCPVSANGSTFCISLPQRIWKKGEALIRNIRKSSSAIGMTCKDVEHFLSARNRHHTSEPAFLTKGKVPMSRRRAKQEPAEVS